MREALIGRLPLTALGDPVYSASADARGRTMAGRSRRPLVTISASYGAGGTVVGPGVAERLGVPFLDRAIPATVAKRLAAPFDEAIAAENHSAGVGRVLADFAQLAVLAGGEPRAVTGGLREDAFNQETERIIRELAESTGGAVLGRAAGRSSSGGLPVLSTFASTAARSAPAAGNAGPAARPGGMPSAR